MLSRLRPHLFLLLSLAGVLMGAVFAWRQNQTKTPPGKIYYLGSQKVTPEPIPERPVAEAIVRAEVPPPIPVTSDYRLIIEKIHVDVPVLINIKGTDEKEYLKALRNGVAHYRGTPKPGSGAGNTFIFGHSSYLDGAAGNYKEVFRQLNQVKNGERLTIRYLGNQIYNYEVYMSQIVLADNISMLAETKEEIITLATCWPPGTTDKRYVVQAKRVE